MDYDIPVEDMLDDKLSALVERMGLDDLSRHIVTLKLLNHTNAQIALLVGFQGDTKKVRDVLARARDNAIHALTK